MVFAVKRVGRVNVPRLESHAGASMTGLWCPACYDEDNNSSNSSNDDNANNANANASATKGARKVFAKDLSNLPSNRHGR